MNPAFSVCFLVKRVKRVIHACQRKMSCGTVLNYRAKQQPELEI